MYRGIFVYIISPSTAGVRKIPLSLDENNVFCRMDSTIYSKVFLSLTNKCKVIPRYWKPFQKIPLSVEENIATLFHWHLDSAIYNKFFLSFPHINTGDLIRKFLYL